MKTSLTNPQKIEILKKLLELINGNFHCNICIDDSYYPNDKIEGEILFEYQTGNNKRIIIIKELITEFEQLT